MSNPYAPPKTLETDEPSIHLAPELPFRVMGDSLICREEVDVSQYCYRTGETPVVKKRKQKLQSLPHAWQLSMNISFALMGLALFVSAVLGLDFAFMDFWPVLFFPLVASFFAGSQVTMTYRLSETVERQHVRKLWLIGLAFSIIGIVINQLLQLMGRPAFHGCVGFSVMIGTLFSCLKRHVRVDRLSNGLFRIDNLPPQLIAKLRNHDQFSHRETLSESEAIIESDQR